MRLVLLFALVLIATAQDDSGFPDLSCPMAPKNASVSMDASDLIFSHVHQRGRHTQAAISASNAAMTIGGFTFRIVGIAFDKTALGFVPVDIDAGDEVMFIEIDLLSGSRESFRNLRLTVASPSGRKMNPIIMASEGMLKTFAAVSMKGVSSGYQPGKSNIAWAFAVPRGTAELFLNFGTGEVVDLSPLIKRSN